MRWQKRDMCLAFQCLLRSDEVGPIQGFKVSCLWRSPGKVAREALFADWRGLTAPPHELDDAREGEVAVAANLDRGQSLVSPAMQG